MEKEPDAKNQKMGGHPRGVGNGRPFKRPTSPNLLVTLGGRRDTLKPSVRKVSLKEIKGPEGGQSSPQRKIGR